MPKVLVIDPIAQAGIDLLKKEGLDVKILKDSSASYIKKEIINVEAVLVRTSLITKDIIEQGKDLKVISRHGVGIDNIDVQFATKKGIYVTNTPTANNTSVSEHIIGLMIALAKKIRIADVAVRQGRFAVRNEYIGLELEGKVLGIVGLGKIGLQVAKMASAGLNMKVISYDPYRKQEEIDQNIELITDWEKIFAEPDFVSLNLPLTKDTRGLVGMKEFKLMGRTAFLINCARGGVVKESELIQALQKGLIAGAGLDVFEIEPPDENNPLFKMENTIITPHMAAHSKSAMIKMATHAAQGIIEVLKNNKPTWSVNEV